MSVFTTAATAVHLGRLAVKVSGNVSSNAQRFAARKAGRRRTAARLVEEMQAALAPSLLGSASVGRDTVVDYSRRLGDFWAFVGTEDLATGSMATAEGLDAAVAGYMDHLWQEGEDHNEGEKLLSALEFTDPHLGKNGTKRLPVSRHALKGWRRRRTPQCPVDPMPESGAGAISEWLVENQSAIKHGAEIALWVMFQLTSYCRPSESRVKLKYVLAAAEESGPLSWPSVVVRPFEEELPSKNGSFNHGIVMDDPSLLWVGTELVNLKVKRVRQLMAGGKTRVQVLEQPLWPFSHAEALRAYQQAGRALSIESLTKSVYPLRHGGASRDCLSKRRGLEDIRRRGNWAVMSSVQKYERSGRLLMLVEKLGRHNHARGQAFLASGGASLRAALSRL